MYNEYIELQMELKNNYGNEKERKRMLDLLEYEINEIDDANFKVGEDIILEEKSKIMRNSEKIYESISRYERRSRFGCYSGACRTPKRCFGYYA